MNAVLSLHSIWAYVVLIVLVFAVVNAFSGLISKRVFGIRDLRLSLFGLIVSHIQLLIGLILYFISPKFQWWSEGMGAVMKNSTYRLYLVEHPVTNILAIVLITMGLSMHKRQVNNNKKFVRIALFYALGLLLLVSRIPWEAWP